MARRTVPVSCPAAPCGHRHDGDGARCVPPANEDHFHDGSDGYRAATAFHPSTHGAAAPSIHAAAGDNPCRATRHSGQPHADAHHGHAHAGNGHINARSLRRDAHVADRCAAGGRRCATIPLTARTRCGGRARSRADTRGSTRTDRQRAPRPHDQHAEAPHRRWRPPPSATCRKTG